jgi:ABC-2 type transport system permease protein
MAYSTSFLIQVFGMALNNSAFVIFWIVLFDRIGGNIAGYAFADVMFLWAVAASGVGLGVVFFGNAHMLSRVIYAGELDVYLLQPKPVLPNVVMSRMIVAGWGDFMYGVILFVITQKITLGGVALFALFAVLLAFVYSAIRVIYHSISFYLGNAEGFAQLAGELIITFMIYPGSIFKGASAWILHSLIPAAIVAYIPARIFKEFDLLTLLIVIAADAVIVAIAFFVFKRGLRRYESGNLIGTRM